MINEKDTVRLDGIVTATGTGTFTVAINEFYVDGEWHKFDTPKVIDIASTDYTDALTSLELAYVKAKAASDSSNAALTADDLAIAKSIAKKLGGADQ